MHNIKRVKQSEEAIEARKRKEQAKITEYLALTDDVLARKKKLDWSKDAFDLTTRLLQVNPEFYTVWNYRRNIFLNGLFPSSNAQQINDLLADDLEMTMAALKLHPKVYWIWNHRTWCLENVPEGPDQDPSGWRKAAWDRELFAVEKMLNADARNFHAWGYRRYVLASMPIAKPKTAELAYTRKKIEANFSNFSAWHQRSKVYTELWEAGKLDIEKSKEKEFELVRDAMYTDPSDQSVWMYHRWLIGSEPQKSILEREITVIQELLDEQPDSKWCMESLVHYKRLLARIHVDNQPEKDKLTTDCLGLLAELKKIDSMRLKRYEDIENELTVQV